MTTARPDLVIRGGTVVTDTWSGAATVTVAGGRITGVLDPAAERRRAPRCSTPPGCW